MHVCIHLDFSVSIDGFKYVLYFILWDLLAELTHSGFLCPGNFALSIFVFYMCFMGKKEKKETGVLGSILMSSSSSDF